MPRRWCGGTLVEHAGETRRLSCGEGGRRHIQPCERVPGLPLLSVAQPEQCQRGSVGGWLEWRAEIQRQCARSCSVPRPVSLCVGFCTRPVHSTRRRRRPEPGWRCEESSLGLPRWFRRGGVSERLEMLFSPTSSPGVVGRSGSDRASLQGTSVLP